MGFRIATNVQSIAAQRHLSTNGTNQKASLEKLSSGARINRASDDAAGLAISERMRAVIRSVRQDQRNANDGISLLQTAEGGMNETANILVRFRELSIQAASDTVGDTERGFIDKEVQQLKQEIDRIAQNTEFNGRKLLLGEGETMDFHIGVNNTDADKFKYEVAKLDTTAGSLGVGDISVTSKEEAQVNLDKVDQAINNLNTNRAEIGALQNRLGSAVSNLMVFDENMSAARSRIYDVDVAAETAELTKQNILTQAGTSVLGQANQNNMTALKLIG